MKKKDLLSLTKEELRVKKTEFLQELRKIRFDVVLAYRTDMVKKRDLKRNIARINTVLGRGS